MSISANAMSDNDELQQIAHLRREYTKGGLRARIFPPNRWRFLNAG